MLLISCVWTDVWTAFYLNEHRQLETRVLVGQTASQKLYIYIYIYIYIKVKYELLHRAEEIVVVKSNKE